MERIVVWRFRAGGKRGYIYIYIDIDRARKERRGEERRGEGSVKRGKGAYGSIVTHCLGWSFVFRDWPGVSWTSRPM